MSHRIVTIAFASGMAIMSAGASSQAPAYPNQGVRIIVPMTESGYPQLTVDLFYGMFAPASTPAPILERLREGLMR